MKYIIVNMKQFKERFKVYSDNVDIYESIIINNGSFITFNYKKYIDSLTDFNIFFTYR